MLSKRFAVPQMLDASLGRSALLGALAGVAVTCSVVVQLSQILIPSSVSLDVSSWSGWQAETRRTVGVTTLPAAAVFTGEDSASASIRVEPVYLPANQIPGPKYSRSTARPSVVRNAEGGDQILVSQAGEQEASLQEEIQVMQAVRSHLHREFLVAMGESRESIPVIAIAPEPAPLRLELATVVMNSHVAASRFERENALISHAKLVSKPAGDATASQNIAPTTAVERQSSPKRDDRTFAARASESMGQVQPLSEAGPSVLTVPMSSGQGAIRISLPLARRETSRAPRAARALGGANAGHAPDESSDALAQGAKLPGRTSAQARESLAEPARLVAVEAFKLQQKVAPATFSAFSGSSQPVHADWVVIDSPNHMPTLAAPALLTSRISEVDSQLELPAMVLSENAASILGALVGARIEKATGLVFGRLPAGWTMEFSGRSERPIYLDDQQSQIAQDDVSKPRWFALVNVEPGMHLLSLVSPWSGERAPMSVPVVSGHATALPLASPVATHLTGVLRDASVDVAMPMRRAAIKRVGIEDSITATDRQGHFDLGSQLWIPGTPIALEATPFDGFTHRYSLAGDFARSGELSIFAFPLETVRSWVSSLEGGVSDQSGIVVASATVSRDELAAMREDSPQARELGIGIQPIEVPGQLSTETYDLDMDRHLRESKAQAIEGVRSLSLRSVGVQVESGMQRVQVESEGGARLWSTLLATSPGVINVVTR